MLYWEAPTEQDRPRWLDGCENVQNAGRYWWVGSPLFHPNFQECTWTATAKGWSVCQAGGFNPSAYVRPGRWAMILLVEDARGNEWRVPALLAPDGVPAVAQVRKRINGEWVREYVDESQQAAIEAAQMVRSGAAMTLEEQSDATSAIMENAYYIDADTFAVLGLIDDVLAVNALKMAAAMMEESHGEAG